MGGSAHAGVAASRRRDDASGRGPSWEPGLSVEQLDLPIHLRQHVLERLRSARCRDELLGTRAGARGLADLDLRPTRLTDLLDRGAPLAHDAPDRCSRHKGAELELALVTDSLGRNGCRRAASLHQISELRDDLPRDLVQGLLSICLHGHHTAIRLRVDLAMLRQCDLRLAVLPHRCDHSAAFANNGSCEGFRREELQDARHGDARRARGALASTTTSASSASCACAISSLFHLRLRLVLLYGHRGLPTATGYLACGL
mmetsp:Transcript_36226/g.77245  ORF Transcript_36226/g.77245 Transcript_36226/m.77245 type:complete len:258 (+) Transcript_36226:454-1227(+)